MVKRFIKFVAVLCATGGLTLLAPAFARADSQPASASNSSTTETVVTVDSSSTTTTDSSTTVVEDSKQSSGTSEVKSDTPNTTTEAVPQAITDNADKSDATLVPGTTHDDVDAAAAESAKPAESAHDKIVEALQMIVGAQAPVIFSQNTAPFAPVAAPSPVAPAQAPTRQLPPVQGALLGINGALASFVIPQFSKFLGIVTTHHLPQVPLSSLALILIAGVSLIVVSQFVTFLRLSGFHGAARGDAPAGATLTFATPQKEDVIWAILPRYTSSFLVSETNKLTTTAFISWNAL